jgi:hypothetical protein
MFLPTAGYAILPSDRYAADGTIGAKISLTQPWGAVVFSCEIFSHLFQPQILC